jgi:hypothetical protein
MTNLWAVDLYLSTEILGTRGKSIPNFVPFCPRVDPRLQCAAQRPHGPLQPGLSPEQRRARSGRGFVLAGVQPIILCEVVELITTLAQGAEGLCRRTFRVNHVVGEQFNVQVFNDLRPFGGTLYNA